MEINEIITFIKNNSGTLAILLTIIVIVFETYHYFSLRKQELDFKKFEFITQSLNELSDKTTTIQQQTFFIYELRNHPKYYDVIEKILKDIIEKSQDDKNIFINEVNATLDYIKKKNK